MKYDVNNEVIKDIENYIVDLANESGTDCYNLEIVHCLKLLEHLTGLDWSVYYDRTTDKWYIDYEED